MSEFVYVANKAELKDGEMKSVSVSGREILVARVGGSYYATENRCPHMGVKLTKGKLNGTVVTCPLHGSQFDLTNGQVVRWTNFTGLASKINNLIRMPKSLVAYKVKSEGETIFVEL